MRVDFYHLTARPIEQVLPRIAERVLGAGGRLLVVSDDAQQRGALDRHLWVYRRDSFLPHAEADGSDADTRQPVLLSADVTATNGARNVALADGAWRDAALAFERAFHFFDEARIEEARAAWRTLAGQDAVERRYWKQADGGWERVA